MTLDVKVALNLTIKRGTFAIRAGITFYFMLSGRISRNIGENIFRSYTGTTSENTDFHVLVA